MTISSPPMPVPDDSARQRVLATIDSIPRGRVSTYGRVADEAGLPRRARFVGRVLGELPRGSELPWHRVLGSAGNWAEIRTEDGTARRQARLLRAEGVEVVDGRVALDPFVWP